MHPLVSRAMREVYRREMLPPRALWWLAAAGMRDWYRVVGRDLGHHVGDSAQPLIARLSSRMFQTRYDELRQRRPELPDRARNPEDVALVMAALYRVRAAPKAAWIFSGLPGGSPYGVKEWLRAEALVARIPARERWEEVTVHLGELLIVLTEDLPKHLPHARRILGEICFQSGARYAAYARKSLGLGDVAPDGDNPALAIEVLRMTEYIFRVNPVHWGATDAPANTGWLEGTACPWYTRPGWNGAHCGIFGQFQAGICSEFGLKYNLSQTIPKHGGNTCRVDLKPIGLRKSRDGAVLG